MRNEMVRVDATTHKTLRQMSRVYGLPMSTVVRIAVEGLATKAAKAYPAIKLIRRTK